MLALGPRALAIPQVIGESNDYTPQSADFAGAIAPDL